MITYVYILTTLVWVNAAETNITINPGDDIQAAVDKVHAGGGGTVILNAGSDSSLTYTINQTVLLYSNITLQGAIATGHPPTDIIITIDPKNLKWDSQLITSKENSNVKNIKIINLSIVGNIQPSEQQFPASCFPCAKNCSDKKPTDPGCSCLYQCANMRTGQTCIGFGGGGTTIDEVTNENLLYENVYVSHCSMGITGSGWRNVVVKNCHTFKNGLIDEYFHNIYFRRNFNITISGLISYESPTGCGINMSQGSYYDISSSIFHDNFWRGLRIGGENGYYWHNIHVYNNTAMNNGDWGFRFCNGSNGIVHNNTAHGNFGGPGNLYVANLTNVSFSDNNFDN